MNKIHTFSNINTHMTIAGALTIVFGAIDDQEIIVEVIDDNNYLVGYLLVTYEDGSDVVSVMFDKISDDRDVFPHKTNLVTLFNFPKSQDSVRQILDCKQKILLELVTKAENNK